MTASINTYKTAYTILFYSLGLPELNLLNNNMPHIFFYCFQEKVEYIFLFIFTAECIMKIIAQVSIFFIYLYCILFCSENTFLFFVSGIYTASKRLPEKRVEHFRFYYCVNRVSFFRPLHRMGPERIIWRSPRFFAVVLFGYNPSPCPTSLLAFLFSV
jgi:hypothetical protein